MAAINDLVPVKTNAQIEAERTAQAQAQNPEPQVQLSSLISYINDLWQKARTAKLDVEARILKNVRMYRNEYDPTKLAAIREMGGSEAYLPLVNIKCRAGQAWVNETLFQPNNLPWGIDATPEPELSEDDKTMLQTKLMLAYDKLKQQYIQQVAQAQAMGMMVDPREIAILMQATLPQKLQEIYDDEIERISREKLEEAEEEIDDQLVEGGFYQALEDICHDIFYQPTVFIKGPIYRREKTIVVENGTPVVQDKVVRKYERRTSLTVYPAPYASNVQQGYLFDLITLTPKELSELKGVEGYDSKEIDAVLDLYSKNGLRMWTTVDTEKLRQENKSQTALSSSDTIDCLEFYGDIEGKMLKELNVPVAETIDDHTYYPVTLWKIENHIIKVMLNYDPLGKKPWASASLIPLPNAIWGLALPDIIGDIAMECNAINRALANNSAIASGPLVERNVDRVPAHENKAIYPWKMFDSTESAMVSNAPAYRFYTPPMVGDRLQMVLDYLIKLIDEVSGIPAYAHGDVTVGGAGRTASGLSMLTSNANRGIKNIIKNIDKGIIEDVVSRHYYLALADGDLKNNIPDTKIIARGSLALMEKEVQSQRLTELLQATTNPFDMELLGQEGRRKLLERVAKANGIYDIEDFFGSEDTIDKILQIGFQNPAMQMMGQMGQNGMMQANPAGFNAMTGGSMNRPAPGVNPQIAAGDSFQGNNGRAA